MSRQLTERGRLRVLALVMAGLQMPVLLLVEHFHGTALFPVLATGWGMVLVAMLTYVTLNLLRLYRVKRSAR